MSEEKVISLGKKKKGTKAVTDKDLTNQNQQASEVVYCSFCGRPNTQVIKMIQGPGVNICSECTMIAVQYLILQDRMPSAEAQHILDAFWGKAR